ncbi:peptide-methionine (S)-S-oxide reductase MsrA [Jiulongibacter sp. NS-SX5]|uniref:peptide-methionine (S)-S-oxide reductase MsrA n=1 Tax=Jiulongibacter sp. NS-SX5 TaxID=3463854 RepID=UPI004058A255
MKNLLLSSLIPLFLFFQVQECENGNQQNTYQAPTEEELAGTEIAYFASGCFWCVEAIYESVKGVKEVVSGYSGGTKANPTYEEVGRKTTGHAETVAVYYDPEVVSFETLVKVFYGSQDATTYGQNPDFGEPYRSIIFFENENEKAVAEAAKVAEAKNYSKPIVTEIKRFEKFWPAEEYHQDYEKRNPNQPYVRSVSIPRLNRFKKKFPELLK